MQMVKLRELAMPNEFRLAAKDGVELAYNYTQEGECLATPARNGLFIIEKSPDFFMGYRTAYIGTDTAGWQKVSQALNEVPPETTDPTEE